jgi:hypothetical protein
MLSHIGHVFSGEILVGTVDVRVDIISKQKRRPLDQ